MLINKYLYNIYLAYILRGWGVELYVYAVHIRHPMNCENNNPKTLISY